MIRGRVRGFTSLLGVLAVGTALAPSLARSEPAPTGGSGSAGADGSGTTAAGNSEPGAAPAVEGPSASRLTPFKPRKAAPGVPPPSPAQVRALEMLQEELEQYKAGARDFQRTLTMIVRHHYEERRRRVLTALDREIAVEMGELEAARDEAIARLEKFVAYYSGDNAHAVATPDAMFRLAALYEERARSKFDVDLSEGLNPAIGLYRRIIREFPEYEELAGVYYFLGHAYTDSERLSEGQQAWRALVCANRYSVKDDPDDAARILLEPLPQDHDERFWNDWYNKNPVPLDKLPGGAGPLSTRVGVAEEELRFRDPYPESCEGVPQNLEPGEEPRYVAEIWWQIGNYHFDQIDIAGGPYELNRAMSAYEHSMKLERPPLYGVAMYKRAWTYFKQQRYRTAVEWFVNLLHYADEQERETGDPGADFRSEAYTYIAGSLTYEDFDGPPGDHPYIPRSDVLDVETDPLVAEDRMRIAIERVQNPELIPQDKKWTPDIYKALAQEFIEITQNRNAIATLELTLEKFPMDRDAPKMQNKVAELYDQLAKLAPDGSAVREEYAKKALRARSQLAAYVGTTPWTDANRDDPEALQQAEELVRHGLQRAAADHTNYARNYFNRASEVADEAEQRALIEKAIAEYRLAETGWAAYIEQDPTSPDVYESKFWLADARYWVAVLQVAIGRSPSDTEVERAREAAVAVRDSNEDDRYLQPAAFYVVSLAEKILENRYQEYEASGGARGLEKREEVQFSGEGEGRRVTRLEMPAEVVAAVRARDEYNARVDLDRDPQKNGPLYAFQAADYHFVYGQFEEARGRFEPLYEAYCGQNEWGYKAWEKLISMSNFEGDADRSRKLAEGKSCAHDEETRIAEESIRNPVRQGVAYLDARKLYDEAEKMPEGPERDKKWREAAAAYKTALDAAPDRDEAPEAAMNGAFAYKQVGEYDKAIEMYELFIARYGSDEKLGALKNGDPGADPPAAPDPAKYEERVKFLQMAYDALASARVLFFDYPKAAETFDKISTIEHFPQEERREAAKQSLSLYASLGDKSGMNRARDRFVRLGASPEEQAEADYVIASAELKKWDEYSPDQGANAEARRRAEAAMRAYHDRNRNRDAAARYVVSAAYWTAKAKRAAGAPSADEWWRNTIRAFERYRGLAPKKEDGSSSAVGSAEASLAAEADYRLLDAELRRKFDHEAGHHRFAGTPVEVIKKYQDAAKEAKKHYDELQRIVNAYASPEWTAAAVARQGSLYDSLRTGLYNVRPPELVMFDKKTEALLKKAEESDNLDLQERADEIRINVQTEWRDARDRELDGADRIMVDRYANSVTLARRYNVSNPAVVRAIQRLAFMTEVIGEAKLKEYTSGVKDLNYTEGMFLRIRPGLVQAPEPQGMPHPLPVMLQ